MASQQNAARASIEDFLKTVGGFAKTAEANTEPGSQGGPTEHPVKNVDDGTEKAKEGFRSKENSKDVKEDQGAPSVDSTPEATAKTGAAAEPAVGGGAVSREGSAAEDQLQIGTNKQPTGDDPAHETKSVKDKKDDPGSSHPARTDNESLNGGKYAYDQDTPLEKMASMVAELGEQLCAQIVVKQGSDTAPPAAATAAPAANEKQAAADPAIQSKLAQLYGWEMAGLVTGNFDKRAADSLVQGTLELIIKQAADRATRVAAFLASIDKQAASPADDPTAGHHHAGGAPSDGGGAGGPSGEAAAMAAMGGAPGGGGPGASGPPGAGGAPTMPGGGDPTGGAGGGGQDAEALQLAQLLASLGITPDQLEQALAQQASQSSNAMAGAGSDMGGGQPGGGMTVAAADKTAFDTLPKEKQAALVREHVAELIARSRRAA